MRKVCTKMVPKNLTTEQKANRWDVCLDLLDRLEREPEFFSRVITGDKSWIFEYDPETKRQSRSGTLQNLPNPRKREWANPKSNRCSFVFFLQSGDRPQGICATRTNCQSNFLSGSLWKTQENCGTCATGIARTWMLHHDSAPCHTAVSINEFLAEKSIPVVPQSPYSPDLSPCDFFLFPRLKHRLKGRHFRTLDNIQKSVTDELKGIPRRSLPALLRTMETTPPSLCSYPRELFWRG